MLKSLFEASIDKLNIPSEMKTAIKEINKICLEAEGNDTSEAQPAQDAAQENTDVDNANGEEEIWKVLSSIQKKAVQNKGTPEGEKWRKKLDDEYLKAVNHHGFKRVKGFEMTINNPDFKKGQAETNAAKNTAEAQPAQAAGAADNSNIPNVKQGSAKLRTEVLAKILKDKGNDDPIIEPIKDVVKLINNPETLKEGSAKLRTEVLPQLINYYGNDDPIIKTVIDIVKVINTPDAKQGQGAGQSKADVSTVQYYLQSTLPNSNVVADGIMGPKTITAIQQKAGLKTTGKMDGETQKAFNQLLAEAKEKVKATQEKLGVEADGIIGKQTLNALAKAKMHTESIFTDNPTTPKEYATKKGGNTQVAGKQGGNAQGAAKKDENVLDQPFDAAKAKKDLDSKQITQREYNIWKAYGIAPVHQRLNPQETQTQIAQIRKQQQEQNAAQGKSNEPNGLTSRPFKAAEADALLKEKSINQKQYDIWKKYNIAPIFQKQKADEVQAYIAKVDKAGQQKAGQQQVAQQQGGQQQVAQQQKNNPNNEVYRKTQDAKGTTEYYSGVISWKNMTPEEKKLKEQAEAKMKDKYFDGDKVRINPKTKKPYDEQIALDSIQQAGQDAVVKHRMNKARAKQG